MQQGVVFFNKMLELTVIDFFTSKMGIEDLGYKGNPPVKWEGGTERIEEIRVGKCVIFAETQYFVALNNAEKHVRYLSAGDTSIVSPYIKKCHPLRSGIQLLMV
ncbi:gluconate 2-dehydrogenase subunit 3 family protein [Mucilaginibacter flavidus]|uniref:gluconate 2-dehydrogenase subunit 3 family protein n=1 Tax=Mucilaginibacter flavidus TaxID=2949309 RepID=UPI002093A4AB|nr:gluconate 2-dehydrogenase subunit 3 family protein [Mucilaginibacter flavidus]MCO5947037.1 gluconate 2-dehydrogenase subunit 3 family protein [Mucilaginibacter flavidus]